MRKAKKFSFLILAQGIALMLLAGYSFYRVEADRPRLELKKQMVRDWELTDLCLFTEANYTRHLTQADRHTPFQNSPLAFEHFPSGSILLPPEALKR
ncbi:MAG: hypothetical protein H6Q43_1290 [Deltaproteobacteria bacterium]|jgi:hypothetical protein|nr:hypothetical protein [Deltaproteobacteria bacterium]